MIEIKNLRKTYGDDAVVNDLSLTIQSGSVFGFLGQNGAGKTTTMKMLVGITEPDAGVIAIGGKDPKNPKTREQIGFMPEAPYFYERLTGLEFLEFCGALFNIRHKKETYLKILEQVGLEGAHKKAIGNYSKGMKQRLGFAQALVNNPQYVFLDEPLDGLDPIGRKEIKRIIKSLKHEGKTIFFNSHILYDTEELCDAIGVIHEGRLLYSGNIKAFCNGEPLEERFVSLVESHKTKR